MEVRPPCCEDEIEQIYRLNHDVFVTEIGQHDDDGSGRLVDKFHAKNQYLIAVEADTVIGMVALNDLPPFSVVSKLAEPSVLDDLGGRLVEVRLLAIRQEWRHTRVFSKIAAAVYAFARKGEYSHLLISGIVERELLYRRLHFRPLGPAVRSGGASFIPMCLDLRNVPATSQRLKTRLGG